MQTFLPYSCFNASAAALDSLRLGKQRVEAYQIVRALFGLSKGWTNHPATRMWRGYEPALCIYHDAMIDEWVGRGFNNSMRRLASQHPAIMPPWLGRHDLHASHRSNLLRKAPDHYERFGWREPPNLEYVWPV